jgi:hypothetical protein
MPCDLRQAYLRADLGLYEHTALTDHPNLEARMTLAPSILDNSIAHLRTLASALAEQMGSAADTEAADEARACKELLLSVSVLLPKLQAARYLLPVHGTRGEHCPECEDS